MNHKILGAVSWPQNHWSKTKSFLISSRVLGDTSEEEANIFARIWILGRGGMVFSLPYWSKNCNLVIGPAWAVWFGFRINVLYDRSTSTPSSHRMSIINDRSDNFNQASAARAFMNLQVITSNRLRAFIRRQRRMHRLSRIFRTSTSFPRRFWPRFLRISASAISVGFRRWERGNHFTFW